MEDDGNKMKKRIHMTVNELVIFSSENNEEFTTLVTIELNQSLCLRSHHLQTQTTAAYLLKDAIPPSIPTINAPEDSVVYPKLLT
jgi:hypothetical protein